MLESDELHHVLITLDDLPFKLALAAEGNPQTGHHALRGDGIDWSAAHRLGLTHLDICLDSRETDAAQGAYVVNVEAATEKPHRACCLELVLGQEQLLQQVSKVVPVLIPNGGDIGVAARPLNQAFGAQAEHQPADATTWPAKSVQGR